MTEPMMRVHFNPSGALARATRRCEHEVLAHWYGDTEELLAEAYGPYEDCTTFISVTRDDLGVVGFCRLIMPGPLPLKTIADVEHEPWGVDGARAASAAGLDLDRTWDIATLGVRHELGARGRLAATALYHAVIASTRANGIRSVTAVVDRRVRSLAASVGLVLHALPGTRALPYMGSQACAPVYTHVADMIDDQRRTLPDAYRLIALGVGLDGVTLPDPEDYVLPARPALR